MRVSGFGPRHLFWGIGGVVLAAVVLAWAPWTARASGTSADSPRASNVAMTCAPGQQALVHQTVVSGELKVSVECGNLPDATAAAYASGTLARPISYADPAAGAIPAVYRPAPAPAQTYAPPVVSRQKPVVRRRTTRGRDWKKDALVIGGSAGAGAGIGGLIGGKNGALIGAALGGGSAALIRVAGH